jgi:hypothetical protein
MKGIDAIAACMATTFGDIPMFSGIKNIVRDFAAAGRIKIETLRTDPAIFDVWAEFVTTGERLANFSPMMMFVDAERKPGARLYGVSGGLHLLRTGRALVFHIARARTPMPKSTREFIERCEFYQKNGRCPALPASLPG